VAKLFSALMVTVTVAHSVTIDTSAVSVGDPVPYAALESTYPLGAYAPLEEPEELASGAEEEPLSEGAGAAFPGTGRPVAGCSDVPMTLIGGTGPVALGKEEEDVVDAEAWREEEPPAGTIVTPITLIAGGAPLGLAIALAGAGTPEVAATRPVPTTLI
jgi:hypothetical protein